MGMTLPELCLKKRALSSVLHLGREGVGGDSLKHPSPLRVSVSVNPGAACLWLDPFLPHVALHGSCIRQDWLTPSMDAIIRQLLLLMASQGAGLSAGGHRHGAEALQME